MMAPVDRLSWVLPSSGWPVSLNDEADKANGHGQLDDNAHGLRQNPPVGGFAMACSDAWSEQHV